MTIIEKVQRKTLSWRWSIRYHHVSHIWKGNWKKSRINVIAFEKTSIRREFKVLRAMSVSCEFKILIFHMDKSYQYKILIMQCKLTRSECRSRWPWKHISYMLARIDRERNTHGSGGCISQLQRRHADQICSHHSIIWIDACSKEEGILQIKSGRLLDSQKIVRNQFQFWSKIHKMSL